MEANTGEKSADQLNKNNIGELTNEPTKMPTEELKKILNGASADDVGNVSGEDTSNESTANEEKEKRSVEEQSGDERTNSKETDNKADKSEEDKNKADENKKSPAVSELEEKLKAENEKLKKTLANQDKLLAKLGTEVGLLRKKTPQEEREEIAAIRDLWLEDAEEGEKAFKAYTEKKAKEEETLQQYTMLQNAKQNREMLLELLPDIDDNIPNMAEIMKEDGANSDIVNAFMQMPYAWSTDVLLNLYKRSKTMLEVSNLKKEIEKLKSENEELRNKPAEMLRKIETVSSARTLSGKTGGASSQHVSGISNKPVSAMSREELQKIFSGG